jgi:hypothetical protein
MAARLKFAAVLAAVAACVAAPTAHADSISYIKDGNVFLTTPDGERTHQVTTTGGYSSASQSDEGRIVALKGNRIHLMDRWGTVLADFTPVGSGTAGTITFNGPFDPVISPDGRRVAYGFYVQYTSGNPNCGLPGGCWTGRLYAGTGYSRSDGPTEWTDPAYGPSYGWMDPAWIDDSRTLQSGPASAFLSHVGVDTLGDGKHEASRWFSDFSEGVSVLYDAELNRQGTAVAAVANSTGDSLRVYRATGAPVEANQPQGCLAAPSRGSAYESPSWSPNGQRLAWSDKSGIYVADLPGLAEGCPAAGQVSVVAIAPGGQRPDWGPADLPDPASRPTTGAKPSGQPAGNPGSGPQAGGGAPAVTPAAPGLRVTRGKGLSVRVTVPSSGTLAATAKKGGRIVMRAVARKVRAGEVTLTLKRTKAGRRLHGRVAVRVRFTPARGPAREATTTLTVR